MESLYDKKIKARKWGRWFKVLWIILCSVVYFWVAGLISLIVSQYVRYGFSTGSTHEIYNFLTKVRETPEIVFSAYGMWFEKLLTAEKYHPALFIPLSVPVLFLFIVFFGYMRNPHSFNLWYLLHNHFATFQDVVKMRILGGNLMSLGKFEGKSLGINKVASLFGWGASELGKTSSIAIPSILESNNSSVAAIDCTGDLFAYTSGHRRSLGEVFYFNWNLTDDPEKGEFWPRWNPLSPENLPRDADKREVYLKRLAAHLQPQYEHEDWQCLSALAAESVLIFFVSKTEQAAANDYLLGRLLKNGGFETEDESILRSYYSAMPTKFSEPACKLLDLGQMTAENYFPVGSWGGIPSLWKGRELCLSMIADSLVQKYLLEQGNISGRWKKIINIFREEAFLFGYPAEILLRFEKLLALDNETCDVLFAGLAEVFSVFRKSNIRERTSSNDYCLKYGRGMKDADGNRRVTTTYLIADNRESCFMSRMMADMLIERNLEKHKSAYRNPILFVMDDLERLPKFDSLSRGVMSGYKTNAAFLLLTDRLKGLNEIYGKEGVENIISGCTYKLVFADNNVDLSRQFLEMAVYGTKSVQIPAVATGAFMKVKQGIADAYYYRKIADDLVSVHSHKKINKGEHLLLVEGFYNLPVKVDAQSFNQNVRLKMLAEKDPAYYLSERLRKQRKFQDEKVPSFDDVLAESREVQVSSVPDVSFSGVARGRIELEEKLNEEIEKAEKIAANRPAFGQREPTGESTGREMDFWEKRTG